ncbi:MAG TPA: PIN domain-containing protein [Caulobacteraceae bacterium]|nr:PIN domain-containing protein [Caulobacteraceae bacterium]
MKLTVDTNILVRAVVRDDEQQAEAAAALLQDAETIAVSLPCLCEFVWVLRRVYGVMQNDISAAVEALLEAANVAVDRPAAEAGLAVFRAGGDFADGLVAYEGRRLGGETFISFDRRSVSLVARQGQPARLAG